jgi:hypothetical protein
LNRRPAIARHIPLIAALATVVVMVLLSRSFGATWDERPLQKYGEQIWDFYAGTIPRSAIDVSFGYTRIYGGLVEFASVAAQHIVKADPYVVRHAVNSVFGWVGIVFAFLMASRLFGTRAGWLAAVLLASMPRYIGESMNNPKDLPFAVLLLVGLYYIVTLSPRYPYLSWGHALKLALAIALALDVRAMGLALLGYAGIGLLVAVVASRERSLARLGATAGRFAIVTILALVGGTAFWPWAQEQPLVRPVQALALASGFSWGNPSLFGGQDLAATDLPWYYLPTWLAMTLPPVLIAGACLSLPRLWRCADARVRLSALWVFVLLPATLAIVRHLTMYDGIRHMYFIVPPIAVIAAAGWDFMLGSPRPRTGSEAAPQTAETRPVPSGAPSLPPPFSQPRYAGARNLMRASPPKLASFGKIRPQKISRVVAAALLALGIVEPLIFQIRNHPNQNVYFTPVMGGPRAAFGRFEMDYWGNCMLQAAGWADHQARRAGMPIGVAGNAWEILLVDEMRFPSLWFRRREEDGYHLDVRLLKGPRQAVLDTNARPDVLYRVTTADGAPLCVVVPGPEYPRLEERLARAPASGLKR